MLSMLPATSPRKNGQAPAPAPRRAPRRLGIVAALLAAAAAFAPGKVRAETGTPLPQGYTSDVAAPAAPAAPPAVPVQQVSDDEDPTEVYADTDPSALTDFREPLSPYGVWVSDATYGTVWVPNATVVGADFAPYQTSGHWGMTDEDEWLWQSDYDWGYIPFHYGRWVWINARGWSWIPGRVYSPAWVSWRVGEDGYIGWAAMPPAWYWSEGVAVNLWVTPYAAYCFVPTTYVFHEHVHNYVVRDAATVRSVASATRAYKPARPTVAGGNGAASSGGHHFRMASPSLAEAGVPSAPKMRAAPDMRSKAFATHSSTAAVRRAAASGHGFQAGSFPLSSLPSRRSDGSAGMSNHAPASRDLRTNDPVGRSPHDAPVYDSSPASRSTLTPPVSRSAPTYSVAPTPRPSFSLPSSGSRAPSPTFSAPSRSAPTFSAPSRSAPTFSAPSRSAPTFSAPSRSAPTFSAPSRSAPTFSAPSRSSSSVSAPSRSSSSSSHSSGGRSGHR